MGETTGYQIARAGLSLPCSVPVIPGTPSTDAPMEQRTEKCHVDAWGFVGALPICDIHLRVFLPIIGDDYDEIVEQFRAEGWENVPSDKETRPWSEMHRYDQFPPLAEVRS